jgi:hypothetical protein
MTLLRLIAFGFGYLVGGLLGTVVVGAAVSALQPGPGHTPPAGIIAIVVAVLASGVTGGALCERLVNRLTRR